MRTINVTEFCSQSSLSESVFRDTIEASGLSRDTEELDIDILEAIAQEIAQQNGTQLSLPAAKTAMDSAQKLAIQDAVGLAFEVYPEALALDDLQIVQVAAFLTAERQMDAYETVHSAVVAQRLSEYRAKTNAGLLTTINAVRGASDADFLAARGISQKPQETSTVLNQLLKMQKA